ncbi:PDZ and LIM domain protein 7-like isoform X4 [Lineus longissimus]|uniref:PDZ and LIM domain protein 7-like isoform X4 n=1 Tax=Lineus longissimus TaxID=88925 RepID=UPI002B4D4C6E
MAGSSFTCRLYRDGLQTPWGFRLQGGKDFNQPLTVQRVFTGSPAEGELQRGDVIIKINNIDVSSLNHKQAQDIIKTPAGQLVLNIQRGQTRFSPVKSVQPVQQPSQFHQPTPSGFRSVPFEGSNPAQKSSLPTGGMRPSTNFAVDYTGRVGSPTRRPEQTMINRVHDSLNEAIWAHQSGNDPEDDYNYGSVADRKKNFSQDTPHGPYEYHPVKDNVKFYQGPKNKYGAPVVHSPGRPSKTGKGWRPPPQLTKEKPVEFGWSPSKRIQPGYVPGPPTNERAYSPPRPAPAPARPRFVSTHHTSGDGSGPAWKGTLHGAGQDPAPPLQAPASRSVQFSPHKPSSLPHQKPNYHPGPPQQHHQPHVNQPQPQHDGPKVVHLQYNSPIGLYSKQNVDETYTGQTQALQQSGIGGGDGKDMDYTKSYAWQMIKQESGAAPGGGTSHSQSTTETAYHEKQSRSFKALEDSVGASDF